MTKRNDQRVKDVIAQFKAAWEAAGRGPCPPIECSNGWFGFENACGLVHYRELQMVQMTVSLKRQAAA